VKRSKIQIAAMPGREGLGLPTVPRNMFIPDLEMIDEIKDRLPDHYQAVIDLAIGTGLRQGELFGLELDPDRPPAACQCRPPAPRPDEDRAVSTGHSGGSDDARRPRRTPGYYPTATVEIDDRVSHKPQRKVTPIFSTPGDRYHPSADRTAEHLGEDLATDRRGAGDPAGRRAARLPALVRQRPAPERRVDQGGSGTARPRLGQDHDRLSFAKAARVRDLIDMASSPDLGDYVLNAR